MQITDGATVTVGKRGLRDGTLLQKKLLAGKDGTLNNYSLVLGASETEYAAPRHHHNFDQIRYNVLGEIHYGDKVFPAGWVVYFPEGAYYGPQVRKLGSLTLTAQFGGASGIGYVSKKQQQDAHAELLRKGEFKKGVFTYLDENGKRHNKDAFEAVFQQVTASKLVYPPPRYSDIILMNPENYSWTDTADAPGIAEKWLGTFTERGTSMGFIRLERGATFNAGRHNAPELLFLSKGSVVCEGHAYPVHSAFGFDALEGPVPIEAAEHSEFFCMHLPKF